MNGRGGGDPLRLWCGSAVWGCEVRDEGGEIGVERGGWEDGDTKAHGTIVWAMHSSRATCSAYPPVYLFPILPSSRFPFFLPLSPLLTLPSRLPSSPCRFQPDRLHTM